MTIRERVIPGGLRQEPVQDKRAETEWGRGILTGSTAPSLGTGGLMVVSGKAFRQSPSETEETPTRRNPRRAAVPRQMGTGLLPD